MLTKERIESIEVGGTDSEWEMSGDMSMSEARSPLRLALLGLERDERQAVTSEQVAKDIKILEQIHAKSWDEAVALRHAAEALSERDERAERVGRAVLADCALTRFAIETAIDTIRNGDGFDDDDIPKLRAIADAMEEP